MYNQRIEARSSLCTEDRRDGLIGGRIAAQAIDRLGRERDQLAAAQERGGAIDLSGAQATRHEARLDVAPQDIILLCGRRQIWQPPSSPLRNRRAAPARLRSRFIWRSPSRVGAAASRSS